MKPISPILTAGLVLAGLSGWARAGDPEATAASEHPVAVGATVPCDCPPGGSGGTVLSLAGGMGGRVHPLADLGRVETVPVPPIASVPEIGLGVPTESLPPLALPPLGGPEAYWRAPSPGLPIGGPPIPVLPKSSNWIGDLCDEDDDDHDCDICDHCNGCGCWHCCSFFRSRTHHGAVGFHHGRAWRFASGELHGFPFTHSHYKPRAVGASYTFGRWVPRRSFYYPYVPGIQAQIPYGFSPEPYYFPEAFHTTPGL